MKILTREDILLKLRSLPYDIKSKIIRNEDKDFYGDLSLYTKTIGFKTVSHLLETFVLFNDIITETLCPICHNKINLIENRIKCCSRSCRSLFMHQIRPDDVKKRFIENLSKTNATRKSNGETTEHAKRSFATRKVKYTQEELKEQYLTIKQSAAETIAKKRAKKEKEFINRFSRILFRKSFLLIMRMYIIAKKSSILRSTYSKIILDLSNFGFIEVEQFDTDLCYNICMVGFKILGTCPICSKPVNLKRKTFCSSQCANSDPGFRQLISESSKKCWRDPTYRNTQIEHLNKRHANSTTEEKKQWAQDLLNSLGETGLKQRRDAALKTKLERGLIGQAIVLNEESSEYRDYRNAVNRITNVNKDLLEQIELRGKHTYHVDHIFPIQQGFRYKVPPEIIGSLENLRMIPAKENISKSNKIVIIPEIVKPYLPESVLNVKD